MPPTLSASRGGGSRLPIRGKACCAWSRLAARLAACLSALRRAHGVPPGWAVLLEALGPKVGGQGASHARQIAAPPCSTRGMRSTGGGKGALARDSTAATLCAAPHAMYPWWAHRRGSHSPRWWLLRDTQLPLQCSRLEPVFNALAAWHIFQGLRLGPMASPIGRNDRLQRPTLDPSRMRSPRPAQDVKTMTARRGLAD